MPLGSKMAPPRGSLSPIDLQWEKHKKNLLLRNHKAQSFHILSVAMYSGPLYKSCQPCPWGPYGPRPGGVLEKTLKNLLLQNHKTQSFHILCVAMYKGGSNYHRPPQTTTDHHRPPQTTTDHHRLPQTITDYHRPYHRPL